MLSEVKASARQAIHDALGEPASYLDKNLGVAVPTEEQRAAGLRLTIRWHNKLKILGERNSADAGIIEGINRIVFNKPQLDALGITPIRLGILDVPGMGMKFRLEYHEEADGPINDYWTVVQL